MVIEAEYSCPNCGDFVIYQEEELKVDKCSYCSENIYPTGKIRKRDGNTIVVYQNDEEVSREPIRKVII